MNSKVSTKCVIAAVVVFCVASCTRRNDHDARELLQTIRQWVADTGRDTNGVGVDGLRVEHEVQDLYRFCCHLEGFRWKQPLVTSNHSVYAVRFTGVTNGRLMFRTLGFLEQDMWIQLPATNGAENLLTTNWTGYYVDYEKNPCALVILSNGNSTILASSGWSIHGPESGRVKH